MCVLISKYTASKMRIRWADVEHTWQVNTYLSKNLKMIKIPLGDTRVDADDSSEVNVEEIEC